VFATSVGTKMSAGNVRRDFRRALALVPGIDPSMWTPVSCVIRSCRCYRTRECPLEEISQLVGHSGTTVTELVYRHQLKPVIQTGATVMDRLFGA
jgi:integrase